MAQISDTIALLSIHPRHADAILNGSKTVEFRKRPLKEGVCWVVLYATKPVGKLVGVFFLDETMRASPSALWRQCGTRGGIIKSEFLGYFGNSKFAVGLLVSRTWRFAKPKPLKSLGAKLTPPQSFRYVNGTSFRKIESWVGYPLGERGVQGIVSTREMNGRMAT